MGENMSRNAIARELEISGGTVSRIAEEAGHSFDRSQTELALRIRQVDIAAMRADLAKAMLDEAWRSLEDMHSPAVMIQFETGHPEDVFNEDGIRTNTVYRPGEFREHVLDEPTFSDKRNLMTIAGIAVSKAAELTRSVEGAGTVEAISFIDGLGDLLRTVRDIVAGDSDPASDPTIEPAPTSREAMIAELEADSAADPDTP